MFLFPPLVVATPPVLLVLSIMVALVEEEFENVRSSETDEFDPLLKLLFFSDALPPTPSP